MRERGMPLMVYSPIDQGRAARDPVLKDIAAARGLTATQVALAHLLAQPGVLAIPKAARTAHLAENLAAAGITLNEAESTAIDRRFARPVRKGPLAMN